MSTANAAAIAAAMVAIENAKKPAVATENKSAAAVVDETQKSNAKVEEIVSANVPENAIDENDRIMAIATAVAANKTSALTIDPINARTVAPISAPIVSPTVSPTDVGIRDHTKRINGLLVLIAHILKQKAAPGKDDEQIATKPTEISSIKTPSIILPVAKPPTNVDPVKYNKAVKDFKNTIITKYPKVDNISISISPVAIEKDATNNDKYILFASFDVDGINKTEYTSINV
jgi:hypothetical protein